MTKSRKDWERLLQGVRGKISYGASLQSYTSFRIGGPAEVLIEPADVDDLGRVMAQARAEKIPVFVVGGTNLLVRDGGIRGIVVLRLGPPPSIPIPKKRPTAF